MREHRLKKLAEATWSVPVAVEDIAETGRHFDLAADDEIRGRVAQVADLQALPRLQAKFDVTPRDGGGLRVVGSVLATVGQTCVVTLDPVTNEVEEEVDLLFVPPAAAGRQGSKSDPQEEVHVPKWNDPEPLIDGTVDLGALATEFLILGLDPYPRRPGAVFESPPDAKPDSSPFAALAKLTKDRHDR